MSYDYDDHRKYPRRDIYTLVVGREYQNEARRFLLESLDYQVSMNNVFESTSLNADLILKNISKKMEWVNLNKFFILIPCYIECIGKEQRLYEGINSTVAEKLRYNIFSRLLRYEIPKNMVEVEIIEELELDSSVGNGMFEDDISDKTS